MLFLKFIQFLNIRFINTSMFLVFNEYSLTQRVIMKKELLMGTALVSTLGAASVAEAVTATMSGNHQTGLMFNSPTGGTDTNAQINDNNFSVALSETTDGMTISSSFSIVNESTASSSVGSSDMDAGFSLAFTDGSKLDVLNAGNASGSYCINSWFSWCRKCYYCYY